MVSFSTSAAFGAQTNLQKATSDAQASISRLSSGQRIAQASDDVAGLAVGTILKTNVSTLRSALNNTAQASSLLGVADGSLGGVGEVLQRQKALASQATSGSLTDAARGFLNLEFQNLKTEIDRISNSTNFNGIKLLDGSLYSSSSIAASTKLDATQASGVLTIGTAYADTEFLTLNGVTFTFRDTANLASGTAEFNIDATVNATATNQASALYTAINNILNYQGSAAGVLTAKSKLAQMSYSLNGAAITMTAKAAGTVGNTIAITGTNGGTGAATLDTQTVGSTSHTLAAVTAVNGGLNAGTFAASGTAYQGTARTVAQGSVSDSILKALTTTAAATTGVNLANISNNEAFVGTVQGFEAEYVAANMVNLSVKVGDYTYIARNVNTNYTADTIVTLSSVEAGGGSFAVQFAANQGVSSVTNQGDANLVATRMDKAFENVTIYQKRDVTSYTAAGTVYPTGSTTASGNLAGSKFWLLANDFENVKIDSVSVTAPVLGGSQAVILFNINGETYRSGYDFDGSVLSSGIGTSIANNAGGGSDGILSFVSDTNPKNVLVFQYASSTALSLTNDAEAQGAQKAFEAAFGINTGAAGVNFQVGTTSADNIGIKIQSTKTTDIYKDDRNVTASVDISTLAGAQAANAVVDNAINAVTAIRANIGALQSRFKYAASNIESAIQNQDSARGTFLDTDIASESTNYAQAQVKVQASISVLAQANQLSQSLLKLIG